MSIKFQVVHCSYLLRNYHLMSCNDIKEDYLMTIKEEVVSSRTLLQEHITRMVCYIQITFLHCWSAVVSQTIKVSLLTIDTKLFYVFLNLGQTVCDYYWFIFINIIYTFSTDFANFLFTVFYLFKILSPVM